MNSRKGENGKKGVQTWKWENKTYRQEQIKEKNKDRRITSREGKIS
jgi:hypothetical protein